MSSPTSGAAPERNRRRSHGRAQPAVREEGPRRLRPSEAPPTGALTGVLGELAFYYGACWLHYRSAPQRPGEEARR